MSWPASPSWLTEMQERFGRMLRTPLERGTGTLRAGTAAYDATLLRQARSGAGVASAERLAVYNRQYWFRLFTVLQRGFPLTARLLGFWSFNDYAAQFLTKHPPRSHDIDQVGVGFVDFLKSTLPPTEVELERSAIRIPSAALLEAARIDAAYHDVFRAPAVSAYAPTAEDAERLLHSRLKWSPAVALVTEHWPLCELRITALAAAGESALPLPPALDATRSWLLGRSGVRLGLVALEPREAELLELLRQHPVAAALAQLEAACAPTERAELPARAQKWLADSVARGVWVGLEGLSFDDR